MEHDKLATRLSLIIYKLNQGERLTIESLANEFGVSKRTIERDIARFSYFVGALAVAQSNKGVFITTSSFNKNAVEYASKLNSTTTLVLIDGEQLAKYIYDYSLGMQTKEIIEIKELDSDFWDFMEDDNTL